MGGSCEKNGGLPSYSNSKKDGLGNRGLLERASISLHGSRASSILGRDTVRGRKGGSMLLEGGGDFVGRGQNLRWTSSETILNLKKMGENPGP